MPTPLNTGITPVRPELSVEAMVNALPNEPGEPTVSITVSCVSCIFVPVLLYCA